MRALHLLSILAAFGLGPHAFAAAGIVDPAFGNAGIATMPLQLGTTALVIQSDGKPVVNTQDFGIARFNADGSADSGFGSGGIQRSDVGPFGGVAVSVGLQPDGKLLVAGYVFDSPSDAFAGRSSRVAVARHRTDGAADSGFGNGGVATTPITPGGASQKVSLSGLAMQSDGRFVVGGSIETDTGPSLFLIRYNANGTVDRSFGNAGIASMAPGSMAGMRVVYGPLAGPGGTLIVVGEAPASPTKWTFAAARMRSDGALDASFGRGGVALVAFPASATATHAAIQPDGRTLLAGYMLDLDQPAYFERLDFALARLNVDGSSDVGFADGGIVVNPLGTYALNAGSARLPPPEPWRGAKTSIALQPDGRIVQTGRAYDGFRFHFGLTRYGPDGALDRTFGSRGRAIGPAGQQTGAMIASSPDGSRLYVGGSPELPGVQSLVRYVLDSTPGAMRLSSSANPAGEGQRVTITVDVAGLAPSGTVSLLNAGVAIPECRNVALVPTGTGATASCVLDSLQAGSHWLTATYSGDTANSPNASQPLVVTVGPIAGRTAVEFHNAALGSYFITSNPDEIVKVGAASGWQVTGETFSVFADAPAKLTTLCRLWSGDAYAPRSTHFFAHSARYASRFGECRGVRGTWTYEGNVMPIALADTDGLCPDGTRPLYRLYDGSPDGAPHHRYTTNESTRTSMLAQGWIAEGLGVGVMACVPV